MGIVYIKLLFYLYIIQITLKQNTMKAYKLEFINEDGKIETNGYYLSEQKANEVKDEIDNYPENKRYNIKQDVIEIEIHE